MPCVGKIDSALYHYMKFPGYPSGGDLLAVESRELFISGLTSGEPIRGDIVVDAGGEMALLSS